MTDRQGTGKGEVDTGKIGMGKIDRGRRGFLKLAGVAPAVALAAGGGATAAAAEEAVPQGRGLRMTEHVKKYFETVRF